MSPPPDEPSLALATADAPSRLLGLLGAAQARAVQRADAVLLRLHVRLPRADPWQLWQNCAVAGDPDSATYVAFNDGRMGLCAAGWGRLQRQTLPQQGRFAAARAACAALLDQAMDVHLEADCQPDIDAPLAFVGFAFAAAQHEPDPAWAGWGSGQIYVPQVLVYRRATGPMAGVLSVYVPAHSDAAAQQAQALMAQLQLLRQGARAAAHRPLSTATEQPFAGTETASEAVRSTWLQRVAAARAAAAAGTLDKVVLARSADFQAPAGATFAPRATAWALRLAHPQSVCFAMGQRGTAFLGASPEYLVQVCGRDLSTQAVAGTAPRGTEEAQDEQLGAALLGSAKDRSEHAMVADVMADTLRPLCVELRRPPQPQLIRLPCVQHLETPLVGTLRQAGGVLHLVERLHPTPSVGGWPKQAAQTYLNTHEPLDRGYYAGPIGWLTGASDGVFAVAIRSVLLADTKARAYAGAGIVAASDPAAEWQETELKLRTVRQALCVAPRTRAADLL